ncbi:MAG: hypothetical protein M0R22_00900 [Dehalococcoidia bacterium]|jgi:hypothetical protein|nr:hypothetical protein [Dehalococcoidia bacterium]
MTQPSEACRWTQGSDDRWHTDCQQLWYGGLGIYGLHTCPYCGKPIEVKEET